MGEGLPQEQFDNQQPLTEDQLQQPGTNQASEIVPVVQPSVEGIFESVDESEPQHLGTIDHTDDSRWDDQKAETLAPILHNQEGEEDTELEELVDDRNYTRAHTRDTLARHAKHIRKEIDEYRKDPENLIEGTIERAEAHLASQEAAIDKPETYQFADEELGERVQEFLEPYEELYDTNPDHFANMPTSEFVGLVREMGKLDKKLEGRQKLQQSVDSFQSYISSCIDNKSLDGVAYIESKLKEFVYTPDEQASLDERLEAASKDAFDKTPRQLLEDYRSITKEILGGIAKTKLEAAEKAKQDFLDQFKSKEEAAPENS